MVLGNISYKYSVQDGFLEVIYRGDITAEDLRRYGERMVKDEQLPSSIKILTDATNARYVFTVKELSILIADFGRNIDRFSMVISAFVYDSPMEVAYSSILERECKTKNLIHRIFTTREAALNWLKNL